MAVTDSTASLTLPPLDLSLFLSGTPEQKKQFADDFCNCLKRHGFAKLINHGLTDDNVDGLYHWVRRPRESEPLGLKAGLWPVSSS